MALAEVQVLTEAQVDFGVLLQVECLILDQGWAQVWVAVYL